MNAVEWNKKQDMLVEQATRQISVSTLMVSFISYSSLEQRTVKVLGAFAENGRSQLNLLLKLQVNAIC